MRAREFIAENADGSLTAEVGYTLPQTFVIPDLINSDAYKQYRYGLALAAVRSEKENADKMEKESKFGEQFSMIAYTPADAETIAMANKKIGVKATKIGTDISQEPKNINTRSPVTNPGPIRRKGP